MPKMHFFYILFLKNWHKINQKVVCTNGTKENILSHEKQALTQLH